MIGQGTKRFDLYDFFSVFIPGSAFILGLSPLMPRSFVSNISVLTVTLLIGGFIAGRWIHAFALFIESQTEISTHRDIFKSELKSPDFLDDRLVESFYNQCYDNHPDALPVSRPGNGSLNKPDEVANTVYVLARSAIHSDASGRSRTFQAISDFYRSAWVSAGLLAFIYVIYSVNVSIGLITISGQFQTALGAMEIPPLYIIWGALLVYQGSIFGFMRAQPKYRRYYIEYLIVDYLNIMQE